MFNFSIAECRDAVILSHSLSLLSKVKVLFPSSIVKCVLLYTIVNDITVEMEESDKENVNADGFQSDESCEVIRDRERRTERGKSLSKVRRFLIKSPVPCVTIYIS